MKRHEDNNQETPSEGNDETNIPFWKRDLIPSFLRPYLSRKSRKTKRLFWKRGLVPGVFRGPRRHGGLAFIIHPFFVLSQSWRGEMRAIFLQINSIVRNNASLPEGLACCAQDAPNSRVSYALNELSTLMESGYSLGEAMDIKKVYFKEEWIDLIRLAESAGNLPDALSAILGDLDHSIETSRGTQTTLLYFFWLLLAQIGIISFIVMKVLPVFVEIMEHFGPEAPWSVQFLIRIFKPDEHYSQWYGIAMSAFFLCCVFGPIFYRKILLFQSLVTYLLLSLPVVGGLIRRLNIRKIVTTIRAGVAGGIPLPEILRSIRKGAVPAPYLRACTKLADAVEHGESFSSALEKHRFLFGTSFPMRIRLGENQGDLVHALDVIRDLNFRGIKRSEKILTDVAVPMGVFVCGIGVLLVSTATYSVLAAMADGLMNSM